MGASTDSRTLSSLSTFRLRFRWPDDIDAGMRDVASYAIGVGPTQRLVTPEFMSAAKRHGLLVHPYTVNAEGDMRGLIELGVDGMFTNFPDRLMSLRSPH